MSKPPSECDGSFFNAFEYAPIQYEEFDARLISPQQYAEWEGVCVCGKAEADGKRCAFGASHVSLIMREAELKLGDFF